MNTTQKSKTVSAIVSDYMDKLSGNEVKITLFLLEMTDSFGRCYPTQKYVAEKLSFDEEFVRRSINRICETGLIKKIEIRYVDSKTGKPRHKNIYEFKLFAGEVEETEEVEGRPEEFKIVRRFTRDDWFEDLDDVPHVEIERGAQLDKYYNGMTLDMLKAERARHYNYYRRTGDESVIFTINAIVRHMPEEYDYEEKVDPLLVVNDDWR